MAGLCAKWWGRKTSSLDSPRAWPIRPYPTSPDELSRLTAQSVPAPLFIVPANPVARGLVHRRTQAVADETDLHGADFLADFLAVVMARSGL